MICPCCNRPRKNWITTPFGKACRLCMYRLATANVIVQLHGEVHLRRYVERTQSARAIKKLHLVHFILMRASAERKTERDLRSVLPVSEQARIRGVPVPVGLTVKEVRRLGFKVAKDAGPDEFLREDAHTATGYAWVPEGEVLKHPELQGKTVEEIRALGFKVPKRLSRDTVLTGIGYVGREWLDFVRDEIAEGRSLDYVDAVVAKALR